jgi:predicted nucleic acid-binding protein
VKWLLDNNVLLSAIDAGHLHHTASRAWLDAHKADGWCVTVETYLGVIRALMNTSIMRGRPLKTRAAVDGVTAEVLGGKTPGKIVHAEPSAAFLYKAQGHGQIMDFHLVTVASAQGAKVVTRDNGILTAFPALSHYPKSE